MKILTKKQRHNGYKKTLKRIMYYKYIHSIFLCNELYSTFKNDTDLLFEFMLFKPKKIKYHVWFDAKDFDINNEYERFEVRLFVLQLLIEMTKQKK